MRLSYSFTRPIPPEQLQRLFRQTHWAQRRTIRQIKKMQAQSSLNLSVWDKDRLVGYARVLSDGVSRALIDDVIVDQQLQGQKIGTKIMNKLLKKLCSIEQILLCCEHDVADFYTKIGFTQAKHLNLELKPK